MLDCCLLLFLDSIETMILENLRQESGRAFLFLTAGFFDTQ